MMATTSAHTRTMTSAMMNTWMLIQKPFNNDRQARPSVSVDHPKNTWATAWSLASSRNARNATM